MKTIRRACPLSLAMCFCASVLFSQSTASNKALEFDHVAIHVRELAKSVDFYEKVMGLEKIPEPFKDGRHVWFRIGGHSQLHVVGGATDGPDRPIDNHFAFRVASLNDFMSRLDQMKVKYQSFKGDGKVTSRPDGARQIYFQDPDGYWIEVNDATY